MNTVYFKLLFNYVSKSTMNMIIIALLESIPLYFIAGYVISSLNLDYSQIFLSLVGIRIILQFWQNDWRNQQFSQLDFL